MTDGSSLPTETASMFARIVLAGAVREYPNKPGHVLNDASELVPPRALHPAFYGCFDWHSAVHGHWLMVRLLRRMPGLPEAPAMRQVLDTHLSPEAIAGEVAYLQRPHTRSFERTYGWAWLLKLHEEAGLAAAEGGADARGWRDALAPLAEVFQARYVEYLPKVEYPIRAGVHPNTAFGLAFARDWAVWAGREELQTLVERAAARLFEADCEYPAHLEPGGADFFSPALMEAELMRRVLPGDRFARWFEAFVPGMRAGEPRTLFEPARVSDRSDLQIVHLDGLNLSRAWCMKRLAAAPGVPAEAASRLRASAEAHLRASLPHIASGDYAGEHWLATFAMLALE